jgi:hypothetical protein
MTRTLNCLIGGLSLAVAMLCALPIASGFGAPPAPSSIPQQVNRANKSDPLIIPRSSVVRRKPAPVEPFRQRAPEPVERSDLLDGCEPMFSPVTVPSMAHLAGRCLG